MTCSWLTSLMLVLASVTCSVASAPGNSSSEVDLSLFGLGPKIIGGVVSRKFGRYAAYIFKNNEIVGTGSLIKRRWILTAASVFDRFGLNDGRFYRVVLGDFNRNNELDGQQQIRMCNIFLHPNYDAATKENDVAIVQIERHANLNRNNIELVPKIQFDNIPLSDITSATDCFMVGYGEDGTGNVNVIRQRIDLDVLNPSACSSVANFSSNNNLCLQFTANSRPCNRDQGSPVMCTVNGKLQQVGFLSTNGCDNNVLKTGVYVQKYRRFINTNIRHAKGLKCKALNTTTPVTLDPLVDEVCKPSGTSFMVGYIFPDPAESNPILLITTGTTTTVTLTGDSSITSALSQTTYTVTATGGLTVPLTTSLFTTVAGRGRLSLRVTSVSPIHLAISYAPNAIGATQVYPEICLQGSNKEYLVASVQTGSQNMLQINAMQDSTTVQILNENGAVVQTETMNEFDNLIYKATTLTGFRVSSDNAVSVFAGTNCAYIPGNNNYCDTVFQQVPPTLTLGLLYIIPPLKPRTGFFLRVVALEADTLVTTRNDVGNTLDSSTLTTAGQFVSFQITNSNGVSVEASKPVLVAQYSNGGTFDGSQGDPNMVYPPSTDEYIVEHSVMCQATTGTHRAAIIIPSTSDRTNLLLNGQTSISGGADAEVISVPGTGSFDVFYLTLALGPNTISNSGANKFAVIFYLREFYRETAIAERGIKTLSANN